MLYANEPDNLQMVKNNLSQYHDSGAYEQDIAQVANQAEDYLSQALPQQQDSPSKEKLAIVFDIDETVLSNYANMVKLNFGGTLKEIDRLNNKGDDPAIPATLALYQVAKKEHLHIFFITGRKEIPEIRKNTARNLEAAGFTNYDALILKPVNYHQPSASLYKAAARKKLSEQGYHIVLNMGDQMSDLQGGYADRTYKLPNPYYYVP